MRNQTIAAIADRTAREASSHWKSCLESRLEDHTQEAHREVDTHVARYFDQLQMMPDPAEKSMILGAIETLFSALDQVSARFGPGLLETDEREIFVPPIVEAAAIAGLDLSEFEDGDPTFKNRNF